MKKHVSASKRAFDELLSKNVSGAHRIGKDQTRQKVGSISSVNMNRSGDSFAKSLKIETLAQTSVFNSSNVHISNDRQVKSSQNQRKPMYSSSASVAKSSTATAMHSAFSGVSKSSFGICQPERRIASSKAVSGMSNAHASAKSRVNTSSGNPVNRKSLKSEVNLDRITAPAFVAQKSAVSSYSAEKLENLNFNAGQNKKNSNESLDKLNKYKKLRIFKRTAIGAMSAIMVICAAVTVYAFSAEGDEKNAPDALIGGGEAKISADYDISAVGRAAALSFEGDSGVSVNEDFQSQNALADNEGSGTDSGITAPYSAAGSRYTVTFTFYQEESIVCSTPETTVSALMERLGIEAGENKRMYVSGDTVITGDTEIKIDTVEYKTEYEAQPVAYSTEYKDVQNIPRGTTKVYRNGVNGTKTVEYVCEYVNGELLNKEYQSESVTTAPTSQIMYRGVGGTIAGRSYSYYIDVRATTYTGGGITASGLPANESVIAVDPRVIPLGTKVYVTGSYGDFGVRTAADTGGGIKGNTIDVYLETSNPYFANFGWRNMRVYILG